MRQYKRQRTPKHKKVIHVKVEFDLIWLFAHRRRPPPRRRRNEISGFVNERSLVDAMHGVVFQNAIFTSVPRLVSRRSAERIVAENWSDRIADNAHLPSESLAFFGAQKFLIHDIGSVDCLCDCLLVIGIWARQQWYCADGYGVVSYLRIICTWRGHVETVWA